MLGGAVLVAVVLLRGALVPSSGPGAGAIVAGPITLTGLLRWVQLPLALLLAAGGFELGARCAEDEDRTWALGVRVVGALAVLGTGILALGQHGAPSIDWRTIGVALGPVGVGLVLLIALLAAERVAVIAPLASPAAERAVWFLGASGVLMVDRLAPEGWALADLLGSAASVAVLGLVGAGVYGLVLLLGALAQLASDDGGIADLQQRPSTSVDG